MKGHLRERSRDSWSLVLSLGKDPVTGKQRQVWRTFHGKKRQAQDEMARLITEHSQGLDAPPGKVTLAIYLERWLRDYASANLQPATVAQYKWAVRRHIIPNLGSIQLTLLRTSHIAHFYSKATEGGLSAKSVALLAGVLKKALATAVEWQELPTNPADRTKPPRPRRYEPPLITPEDSHQIMGTARGRRLFPLVHTALMTGLRRGELQGLRWSDCDFEREPRLYVRQAAQWLSGQGWSFKAPKTDQSRRAVSLGPETVAVLQAHRQIQVEKRLALGAVYTDLDLVFAGRSGLPIPLGRLRAEWQEIAKESGFPTLVLHDLRHGHASLLLAAGANTSTISQRLGHSSPAFTLATYAHLMPNAQADAVASLDRLLAAASNQ